MKQQTSHSYVRTIANELHEVKAEKMQTCMLHGSYEPGAWPRVAQHRLQSIYKMLSTTSARVKQWPASRALSNRTNRKCLEFEND